MKTTGVSDTSISFPAGNRTVILQGLAFFFFYGLSRGLVWPLKRGHKSLNFCQRGNTDVLRRWLAWPVLAEVSGVEFGWVSVRSPKFGGAVHRSSQSRASVLLDCFVPLDG